MLLVEGGGRVIGGEVGGDGWSSYVELQVPTSGSCLSE